MTHIKVKIQSVEDAKNGVPILDNSPPTSEYVKLKDITVGVLEAGMQSGKTSLMFIAKNEQGIPYYFEMSGDNFTNLAAVVKGARERFGDV